MRELGPEQLARCELHHESPGHLRRHCRAPWGFGVIIRFVEAQSNTSPAVLNLASNPASGSWSPTLVRCSGHEVGAADFWFPEDTVGAMLPAPRIHQRRFPVNTKGFVWLLSHDEVNQDLAPGLGAAYGLDVQARFLKEVLPDGECPALVVDLDSVAPGRLALQGLVKELGGRPHPYPVAAFGYSLEDDQLMDLQAAGIQVFQHGLGPAVFAAVAEQTPPASSDGLSVPSF
jgi:hypothetical protein